MTRHAPTSNRNLQATPRILGKQKHRRPMVMISQPPFRNRILGGGIYLDESRYKIVSNFLTPPKSPPQAVLNFAGHPQPHKHNKKYSLCARGHNRWVTFGKILHFFFGSPPSKTLLPRESRSLADRNIHFLGDINNQRG